MEEPVRDENTSPNLEVTSKSDDSKEIKVPEEAISSPSADEPMDSTKEEGVSNVKGEKISFKMVWNKTNFSIDLGKENTVLDFRDRILELTGIPHSMQKIMYKGLVKDDSATLVSLKISNGTKVMLVGSQPKDLEKVKTPTKQELKEESIKEAAASKEPLCQQKNHKKVLDKGKPDDGLPAGIRGTQQPLPPVPLGGFVNKTGGKVRLTFKLEVDQLWIGTKERTEKLQMSSIRNVVSETIEGQEEYSILGIQLGPTEASRYWLYWFPTQYTEALKETILGKWQSF